MGLRKPRSRARRRSRSRDPAHRRLPRRGQARSLVLCAFDGSQSSSRIEFQRCKKRKSPARLDGTQSGTIGPGELIGAITARTNGLRIQTRIRHAHPSRGLRVAVRIRCRVVDRLGRWRASARIGKTIWDALLHQAIPVIRGLERRRYSGHELPSV